MSNAVQTETCANCGGVIGALETPMVWKENVVCHPCHARLSSAPVPVPAIPQAVAAPAAPVSPPAHVTPPASLPRLAAGQMICPNPHCGFAGTPEKRPRGNAVVMIVLLLIMVLPGLFYAVFMSGYDYICPKCGMKLRSEIW